MNRRILGAALCAALSWLATPLPVRAQGDDAQTRAAARQLGTEGIDLFRAGQYADAVARLDRAAALYNVPALNLYAARSLARLGRWVEANERYLAIGRIELDKKAHADQQ